MTTNPNDLAFPLLTNEVNDGANGMTKREYFAAMAMQGLLACGDKLSIASQAVKKADELINELNKDQA